MYLKNTNHCFASAIQLCQKTKCLSMNIGKTFTNNLANETDRINKKPNRACVNEVGNAHAPA